jgi:hypothetical protein
MVYADGAKPVGGAPPCELKFAIATVGWVVGEIDCGGLDAITGGSVTTIVCDAGLAASPGVALLAVTIRLLPGWPVPPYR